jgi:hypothetical protein
VQHAHFQPVGLGIPARQYAVRFFKSFAQKHFIFLETFFQPLGAAFCSLPPLQICRKGHSSTEALHGSACQKFPSGIEGQIDGVHVRN